MNFAYSDDQELLRHTTRRFLEERHPMAAVRARLEDEVTFDREVWRAGAELGWTALLVPEEHGGGCITDQPVVDLAAVAEVLGGALYTGPFLEANVVANVIARYGDEVQCKEHLPGIASGEVVPTWCLSADGRPDPSSIGVVLHEAGVNVIIDGVARFVHDAHVADLLLVTAAGPNGPSLVLVPRSAATVRVLRGLDLTRRYCEVRLDAVRLPAGNVIGPVGGAAEALDEALQLATVIQSAELAGAGERLLEATVQYAKDRVQFGRPIGSFQAIKHRLADLLLAVEAAIAAARYAALAVADGQSDRDEAVAVAGSYIADAIAVLTSDALQIHGGIGFTWEHDVHLYMRRAKTDQGLYGEPSWHRERLIRCLETDVKAR